MTKQTINNQIDALHTKDVYSLILFALFQLKQDPTYSTLSELAYILDQENLIKLLQYFGGITITIPTVEELNDILDALIIYKRVNLENEDFTKVIKELGLTGPKLNEIKTTYADLLEIMDNVNLENRG